MCGIFGVVNLGMPGPLDADRFSTALATLHHRGPDAQAMQIIGDAALFGHTRLSIIDLSDDSNQPMLLGGRYWLIYNGEIFNYIELRDELAALGATFATAGDSEVLVQAYAHWGADCVSRFNGMWAFAIYDTQDKTLFCSRDRFGIKPFNYATVDGQLLFASEIKALLAYHPALADPDYQMIANYCRTSVGAQHEQTWFRDVKRLMPGTNMMVRDGRITFDRYWNYPTQQRADLSFDDARDQYRALFDDAVRIRMRSDVPLGITLSGGVDSNSIICAMQAFDPSPHFCLTARFNPSEALVQDGSIFVDGTRTIDESVIALRMADQLGLQSEIVDTDYNDVVGALGKIMWHLESGNSAPAVIPLMQLHSHARHHMTVVMDGQGADELLGGYITAVFWSAQLDLLKSGRLTAFRAGLAEYRKTYTLRSAALMALRYASNSLPFIMAFHQKRSGLDAIYGPLLRAGYRQMPDYPDVPHAANGDGLASMLRRQHSGGLVNLLHYGDAISMANSLEARMPFLDHRLVEFVWALPGDYKVRLGVGKVLHREAMRGLVPDDILDDRNKHGFTTPVSQQFRKPFENGNGPLDVLLSERCLSRGIFERAGLSTIIDEHRSETKDHGPLLFRLLTTELWFRTFIDKP